LKVLVSIRERGAKGGDPLPPGVREGGGSVTSKDMIKPKQVFTMKLRVKGGYDASINVSPLNAGPTTNFDIQVVRDNDPNSEVAADKGPDANANVNFKLDNTEIVLVRIINNGKTQNKVQVIYNVSP
jgi:hypothetical protein